MQSTMLHRFALVVVLFALCCPRLFCSEPNDVLEKQVSLLAHTSRAIVYSRVVEGTANSRSNPATYALFVKAFPQGLEHLLVRGRSLPGLGRIITCITIAPTVHRIAFLSDVPDSTFSLPNRTTVADDIHAHALWVCNIDGSDCHRIPLRQPVFDMQWSPGGSTLAIDMVSPSGDHLAFFHNGALLPLAETAQPKVGQWAWLRTSLARIVYEDPESRTIGLLDADTGKSRRIGHLPDPTETILQLAPAPNGKSLLIVSDSAAYLATAPDWHLHPVLRDLTNLPDAHVFWSPDSHRLVLFRAHYTNIEPGAAPAPEKFAELQIRSGTDFAQSRSLASWDLGLSGNGEPPTFLGWLDNRSFLLAGSGDSDARTPRGRLVRYFTDGGPEGVFCDLSSTIDSLGIYKYKFLYSNNPEFECV